MRWERILKWRQDARYVLLYGAPNLYNIVPKSIAGTGFDVKALVQTLETRLGPAI